jgi:xanthine dehydrogenase YagS FAD-binding subunit
MFEFTSPKTIDQALEHTTERSRWLAGGTDLVPEMKLGLAIFARLVNLKQVGEMRGIEEISDGLRIGALATLTEIAENQRIRKEYTALAEACDAAASPQLRNVATIGGNLNQDSRCAYYRGAFHCWLKGGQTCYMREGENREAAIIGYEECVHVYPSDPANALIALDAKISVRGKSGAREIAAEDFFRAPAGTNKRMNVLAANEIITHIQLPKTNARSVYLKAMDRAVWTFALASAAVRLDMSDGTRTISGARIVLGGVAPVPWRENRAEQALIGERVSETIAARAADECLRDAKPLEHNGYKVRLARALVKRAILQIG